MALGIKETLEGIAMLKALAPIIADLKSGDTLKFITAAKDAIAAYPTFMAGIEGIDQVGAEAADFDEGEAKQVAAAAIDAVFAVGKAVKGAAE